jgi:hypothetical protein
MTTENPLPEADTEILAEPASAESEGQPTGSPDENDEVSEPHEAKASIPALATLRERLSAAHESSRKQWASALDRARQHFASQDSPAVSEAVASAEEKLESEVEEASPSEAPKLQTWALGVLHTQPFAKAQERGAHLLLRIVRQVRSRIENLESNLEAARPVSGAEAVAV